MRVAADDLAVCVDCALYLANGDMPDDPEAVAAINEADEREAAYDWHLACGDDCVGYFSWHRCDYCRRPLGGERHPAVVLTDDDEGVIPNN